jgi:hypothetical protein
MGAESSSITYIDVLEKELVCAIEGAGSLDDIEAWLRSRPCVKSVELAGYLMKSNPPQRDFILQCETADGAMVKKIVTIFDLGDKKFQFRQLRDQ